MFEASACCPVAAPAPAWPLAAGWSPPHGLGACRRRLSAQTSLNAGCPTWASESNTAARCLGELSSAAAILLCRSTPASWTPAPSSLSRRPVRTPQLACCTSCCLAEGEGGRCRGGAQHAHNTRLSALRACEAGGCVVTAERHGGTSRPQRCAQHAWLTRHCPPHRRCRPGSVLTRPVVCALLA